MAPLSENPDRDFCAGYGEAEPELKQLLAKPPLSFDELVNDPAVRERVGNVIGNAMFPRAGNRL